MKVFIYIYKIECLVLCPLFFPFLNLLCTRQGRFPKVEGIGRELEGWMGWNGGVWYQQREEDEMRTQ